VSWWGVLSLRQLVRSVPVSVQFVVSSSGSLSLTFPFSLPWMTTGLHGGPLINNPTSSIRTLHAMSLRNQQCVEVFEQTHLVTRYLRVKRFS
jgi:hypothetical protein